MQGSKVLRGLKPTDYLTIIWRKNRISPKANSGVNWRKMYWCINSRDTSCMYYLFIRLLFLFLLCWNCLTSNSLLTEHDNYFIKLCALGKCTLIGRDMIPPSERITAATGVEYPKLLSRINPHATQDWSHLSISALLEIV